MTLAARSKRSLRAIGRLTVAILVSVTATALPAQQRDTASRPDLAALGLEQLMQLEVVFAASKRVQSLREAPSAVSIITAADIRQHGFRTLADVLRSVPSFYVTYDRNYTYVGVRGFARPGDYNSRILLLVNGLRTNDNVYDMAYVGDEFLIDIDLVDRVEVVRGPSAAIYGSSALFAVVNVVTKHGDALDGAQAVASVGSQGTRLGRASYGTELDNGIDILVSSSYTESEGARNLYYPEFDSPSTNHGVARDADSERARRLMASVTKGPFSFEASHVSRDKTIPTGAYTTTFNDPRSRTTDELTLASLAYSRAANERSSAGVRVHFGHSQYHGEYAYDPTLTPNQDIADGAWWGLDLDVMRSMLGRHLLTVGAEYRDNYQQDQRNYDVDPQQIYTDAQQASRRLGLFAQDEVKLFTGLTLHAGVREDWYEAFGSVTSPRVGLIYLPSPATTLKLLVGRAFRAPNEYELHFVTDLYKNNPSLAPERIETMELVAERTIVPGVQVTAAGFMNRIAGLISLWRDPSDDRLMFVNAENISSNGVELGIAVKRDSGVSGRLSYSLQRSADRATGTLLTNSPRHMAEAALVAPLRGTGLSVGLDGSYVSERRTLAGGIAQEYALANLSLLAPRLLDRLELGASIYNLFDTRYAHPGSEEHAQDVIPQDGRTVRVKATLHF